MFRSFGIPELLIVLAIILLLFGVGRVSKIAKELGSGIRSFKDGLQGDRKNTEGEEKENPSSDSKG
ncbi:MAG: twin-arginine translocase TatA/TatE family subunit [Anaerolineaceae bacterium]